METNALQDLENRLKTAALNLPYPPTPQLRPIPGPISVRRTRLRMSLAGITVLLLIVLAAVPPVRAAVWSFIQVGAIRIFGSEVNLPRAEPTPASIPALDEIFGRTTLEDAAKLVNFDVSYPAAFGEPDAVFYQRNAGLLVFLVWLDEDSVQANLTILGPGAFAWKSPPGTVTEVRVGNARAVWLEEPHQFFLRAAGGGDMEVLLFEAGNVLIWTEGELTYRLEGKFSLDEAIRLAESIGGTK